MHMFYGRKGGEILVIKISACVIVKNEEKNLPQWFRCVKELADEYIVVDTGSNDNTKQIAKQNGAKIYDFAWCNDFAAAKNYAIDRANGEWIIFLDADEYFLSNDCVKVKEYIYKYHNSEDVDLLICRLDNIDVDNHNRYLVSTYQTRIFRNRPYIRYKGAVHEALFNSSKQNKVIQYINDVVIYHTGYSSSVMREKNSRNIKLMEEKIEKNGIKPNDYLYLADSYWGIGDYEKTIYYSRLHNKSKAIGYGIDGKSYYYIILSMQEMGANINDIKKIIAEAKKRYPRLNWINMLEGIILYKHKEYIDAERILEYALSKHYNGTAEKLPTLEIDYSLTFLSHVHYCLGMIKRKQKNSNEAANNYYKGLVANKYNVELLNVMIEMIKNGGDTDVIYFLNQIYSKEDVDFLIDALKNVKGNKFLIYYIEKNMDGKMEMVEKLIIAENYRMASEFLKIRMDENYKKIANSINGLGGREEINMLMPKKYRSFLNYK